MPRQSSVALKSRIRLALAGAAVFAGALALFTYFGAAPRSASALAARVIETCASSAHRPTCYDREIPKLMDSGITLEQSFEVVKAIQAKDDSYWFCHVVAHELSEKEWERDPSGWKDVMTRCPVNMCSNGCIHGALQRHFSSEALNNTQISELMPDLMDLCEKREHWTPAPSDTSSCYHELGHLSMYLSGADPKGSQEICDRVAVRPDGRNYLQTCYEGIFMQVFEPRDPDDFGLIHKLIPHPDRLSVCDTAPFGVQKGACWKKGWGEDAGIFCDSFTGELRNACWREAWVVNDERLTKGAGITAYCEYAKDTAERLKCFNKMIYSVMAMYDFDEKKVEPICPDLPEDMHGECYASIVGRMLETDQDLADKALAVCERANKQGVGPVCYERLAYEARNVFAPGAPKAKELCARIPEPYNRSCIVPAAR
jgi:hypothetical protein